MSTALSRSIIAIITSILWANPGTAEEYFCAVSKKLSSNSSYSTAQLQKWMFSVKIKHVGDAAIMSRCSFASSAGAVTCDDYKADFIYDDPYAGHKKFYYFSGQFDVQIFSNLNFIENNGRGDLAFGKCDVVEQ